MTAAEAMPLMCLPLRRVSNALRCWMHDPFWRLTPLLAPGLSPLLCCKPGGCRVFSVLFSVVFLIPEMGPDSQEVLSNTSVTGRVDGWMGGWMDDGWVDG